MWPVIVVVAIVVSVFIFVTEQNKRIKKEHRDKSNLSVWFNSLINKYNKCLDEFHQELKQKFELIKRYNDYVSAEKLTIIERQYEQNRAEASNLIVELNTSEFSSFASSKIKSSCARIEDCIAEMESAISLLTSLNPEPCYQSKVEEDIPVQNVAINRNSYFAGCNDATSVNARYKSLVKIFHPDNNNGDTETFQRIQDEYQKRLARL